MFSSYHHSKRKRKGTEKQNYFWSKVSKQLQINRENPQTAVLNQFH